MPLHEWSPCPKKPREADIVMKLLTKIGEEKHINVFTEPICIGTGSSDAWAHPAVGHVMTMTKSHCESFHYWLTTKGGYLDLQGHDVPARTATRRC